MRKNTPASAERSKIRVLFVDADLAPGDMENLTATLANAIKPTHVVTRYSSVPQLAPSSVSDTNGDGEVDEESNALGAEAEDVSSSNGSTKTPRRRFYRKPEPVNIDMTGAGEKSFQECAKEQSPDSHLSKYLVAAAWLHDYLDIKVASVDHIYTCYKAADWTVDSGDPGLPLRDLEKDGMGKTNSGNFEIGHL